MKIAMIHPSLWGRGGAERQLLRLAIELQKMGNEVEIFTDAVNENCYPDLLKHLTVNVIPHPLWRMHRALGYQATSSMVRQENSKRKTSRADRILRKMLLQQYYVKELPLMLNIGKSIPKGFDIINNHNYPSEWAAFTAKRKLKVPIVWMCNGPPTWFLTKSKGKLGTMYWPLFELYDKATVNYIDRIVTLSRALANDITTAYNKPTSIVRTGVDADFFHRATGANFKKKAGLKDSFVLLQVGNIGQVRRNVDSITILEHLSQKHDNVKLVLDGYGSPSQIRELKNLAHKRGLEDKMIIQQTRVDTELAEVYAGCDVFIYPSHAPWSLAVAEAMAAAKPVIIPKQCGISEVIQNDVTGIIIDQPTPEASAKETAKQIELLISNPSRRKQIGLNAYAYVKNHLSWEQYAKGMAEIFEQTILTKKATK